MAKRALELWEEYCAANKKSATLFEEIKKFLKTSGLADASPVVTLTVKVPEEEVIEPSVDAVTPDDLPARGIFHRSASHAEKEKETN